MAKPPYPEPMGGPELPPHFEAMSRWLLGIAIGVLLALILSGAAS